MLCPAYNGLEAHAFEVEEQLRKLQQRTAAAAAAAADNGISEAAIQARVQAAVEQVRAEELSLRRSGLILDQQTHC
jgi:hypothetical protein